MIDMTKTVTPQASTCEKSKKGDLNIALHWASYLKNKIF